MCKYVGALNILCNSKHITGGKDFCLGASHCQNWENSWRYSFFKVKRTMPCIFKCTIISKSFQKFWLKRMGSAK